MVTLTVNVIEIEGEIEHITYATPYDELWSNAYIQWFNKLDEQNSKQVLARFEAGKITEDEAERLLHNFKSNHNLIWKRLSGESKLVSVRDNPHTRGKAVYAVTFPAEIPTEPIEIAREYFGDSREGFTYGSIAQYVVKNFMSMELAIEDQYSYNDSDLNQKTRTKLAENGYVRRVSWVPEHGLPETVDREWETPTHIVRSLKEYVTNPTIDPGADWNGDSIDYRRVEVYLKPYNK